MEATSVGELPVEGGWQYEPKWDGFRCIAFRDGSEMYLQSKSGEPLSRYFPEVVEALAALSARKFVLDGEIVIPISGHLSFDALLQRIHPAASRIRKLAAVTPAVFIAFDLLAGSGSRLLLERPLGQRRPQLEQFAAKHFDGPDVQLSPATTDIGTARRWLKQAGRDLDGVICKRLDMDYRAGLRDGMVKVKKKRTADCVVGGFRYASKGKMVGSLLLGLYDDDGKLNHVGFTSAFANEDKAALTAKVEKLVGGKGFTGRAPGGPSRWSTKRSSEWQALKPRLVVEVEFDHVTGGRFRHGTRLVRWRPDKKLAQCRMEQLDQPRSSSSTLLDLSSRR
jgi:ATP-dependent DNA ligase